MKKKQYLDQRNKMLAEAQELLESNKFEELTAKKSEIEKLDSDYEKSSVEAANLAALEGKVEPLNMANQSVSVEAGAKSLGSTSTAQEVKNKEAEYERVFAQAMLLRPLSQEDTEIYNAYNPENVYTHSTENTAVVIPKSVVDSIISTAAELHPVLAEVTPTRIKGQVSYPIYKGSATATKDYYAETEEAEDEESVMGQLTLNGKELVKSVTVTFKLQSMSINSFIPFLRAELGRKVGNAKARAFFKGAGNDLEPQGVITAINAEAGTPQKVTYPSSGLTYPKITEARGKLDSVHASGAKIYASATTVWNELANILDEMGRPIFVPDPTAGGVGRILGLPVVEEDALGDGEIVIGNFANG